MRRDRSLGWTPKIPKVEDRQEAARWKVSPLPTPVPGALNSPMSPAQVSRKPPFMAQEGALASARIAWRYLEILSSSSQLRV